MPFPKLHRDVASHGETAEDNGFTYRKNIEKLRKIVCQQGHGQGAACRITLPKAAQIWRDDAVALREDVDLFLPH